MTNYASASFTYTVEQDVNNPATITGLPTSLTVGVAGYPDSNGAISGAAELSFSDAEFTTLGDYKVIISETGSTDATNYPVDSSHVYYVYISVRNRMNSNGSLAGGYVATLESQVRNHDTGDKTDVDFTNGAQRSYLTISNAVSGNLANVDDYFKYRVTFTGARNGDVLTIDGQDSVVRFGGQTISTSTEFTVGESNFVYLKHGQTATIGKNGDQSELPIGLQYNIMEIDLNGYVQYADSILSNISETKAITVDPTDDANKVDFLNYKEGSILTGIAMTIWPYALATGVICGIVTAKIVKGKKKQRRTKCSK